MTAEAEQLVERKEGKDIVLPPLGWCTEMCELEHRLRLLAPTEISVLLEGEKGTGKELVAHYLHQYSGAKGPLVAVNCATIRGDVAVTELFGHEKGSFTGAIARKVGYFAQAQGGTLFLDEVAEMPGDTQLMLLRVLQEKLIRPMGSLVELPVDFRLIAATNRSLEALVREGLFRGDLLDRINGFTLVLPPLQERDDDVLRLGEIFWSRKIIPGRDRHGLATLTPAVKEVLMRHSWPGNVRELEIVIRRARLLDPMARELSIKLFREANPELSKAEALALVKQRGAITMQELARHLALPLIDARRVVSALLAANQLSQVSDSRLALTSPAGDAGNRYVAGVSFGEKFLEWVRLEGSVNRQDVENWAGMDEREANRLLEKLGEAGVIGSRTQGRQKIYHVR